MPSDVEVAKRGISVHDGFAKIRVQAASFLRSLSCSSSLSVSVFVSLRLCTQIPATVGFLNLLFAAVTFSYMWC